MVNSRWFLSLFLILWLLPVCVWATAVSPLPLSASRTVLSLGESLTLRLELDADEAEAIDLRPLERDFTLGGRRQSTEMRLENGQLSRRQRLELQLWPKRAGLLEIPALCQGKRCSATLPIEVSEQPQENSAAEVLLEVEPLPAQVPQQAQLLYRVRLLSRVPLLQARLSEPQPEGVECRLVPLGDERRFELQREGWRYEVIERGYALFPQQAGLLRLPPLVLEAQVAGAEPTAIDPLDPFAGLTAARPGRLLRRQTPALQVEVTAPVAGPGSWLPAQGVRLEDDWQQAAPLLRVGEPASRTLVLRVAGLPADQLPELLLGEMPGTRLYADQPQRSELAGPQGLSAVLEQQLALVPTVAGPLVVPEIRLPWWDVATQQWREAVVPALSLTVAPAAEPTATLAAPPPEASKGVSGPTAAAVEDAAPAPPQIVEPATDQAARQTAAMAAAASPAAVTAAQMRLWRLLALFCAAGWLLTLVLVVWRRRRGARPQPAAATEQTRPALLRQQVLTAARRNDARASRQALQRWAQSLFPTCPAPLERLLKEGSAALRQASAELDRALYAPSATDWEGQGLLDAVRDWQAPAAERPQHELLPPLYPPRPASSPDPRR